MSGYHNQCNSPRYMCDHHVDWCPVCQPREVIDELEGKIERLLAEPKRARKEAERQAKKRALGLLISAGQKASKARIQEKLASGEFIEVTRKQRNAIVWLLLVSGASKAEIKRQAHITNREINKIKYNLTGRIENSMQTLVNTGAK